MIDTNEACKPSQRWILLVGLGSLLWTRLKTVCSDYYLGFGVQQLIPNSLVITSSSQTSRDFLKQSSFNPTLIYNLLKPLCFNIAHLSIVKV